MVGMTKSVCMILIATAIVAWVVPHGEALGCNYVIQSLSACIPYLTNRGTLGGCCNGVRSLYNMAKTPADRQSACSCLKTLAVSYRVNLGKANGLPGLCGISIPYKISPNIDCSTVH